ncbi:MAG: N-acetylmuramoyl-L-alanine amidase, partial [Saprospiraceae bacterium]|nr:N-acetylmuramoyl-L-alanine amidase [Pyrinomonadaceae bacterium]
MSKQLQTIVIDPGHGGTESVGGSSSNNAVSDNGLLEKDLTFDIARRTASVLKDAANVLLTRNADVNLSLAERADIARRNNAAVFLSIHFNGFRDKTIDGVETFVASKPNLQSENLAQNVLQNLVRVTKGNNRGIRFADMGVLIPNRHSPQTAACLAEISFLTNPAQARNLEDAAYRQQIAIALGDAVLNNLPKTSASQSFSFDEDDDLAPGDFQSLDYEALGGDPVFDIKLPVSKTSTNGDDIHSVKKRLIELGFDWITLDKKMDTATVDAIKLFQTIVSGKNSISGDGKIDVGKTTHSWLQAVNAPRWQTMPAGSQTEGFLNYELTDTNDTHDFGTDWMADAIRSAAAHYRDNYLKTNTSAALFTVNDVSLPRGGNTPDHAGHEAGLACDLQLPKTDGKSGGITYSAGNFDRNAARAILKALKAQSSVSNIYFNDPDLIAENLCSALSGHDNHIHFEVKPPARGTIERHDLKHYHSGGRLYQGSY